MVALDLIVFQGKRSQTGSAFQAEFPDVKFPETTYGFDEIKTRMEGGKVRAVLPIWNSHAGEVTISHALSMLFEEKTRLYHLWPQRIIFVCLGKSKDVSAIKNIISVSVAEQQCSLYLNTNQFKFENGGPTTKSYEKFKANHEYGAVLVAPGYEDCGYPVLCPDASNPINFTTFALLASSDSEKWDANEWGLLASKIGDGSKIFTAIQLPLNKVLTDLQEDLFDRLIDDAQTVEDIPKVLFVAVHEYSKCRLLIEAGGEFIPPEMLGEDGASEDIKVVPNVGTPAHEYTDRVESFVSETFSSASGDFIKHQGTKTCFFACPALGIFTHGYEVTATEFVVRQVIKKNFDFIDRGGSCNLVQKQFYEKYKTAYWVSGADFMAFEDVGV